VALLKTIFNGENYLKIQEKESYPARRDADDEEGAAY